MHELSIAEEIVRVVRDEMKSHPTAHLKTVHIQVGALRLIEPSTLQLCFEAVVLGTSLAGARLDIERVAGIAQCNDCGREFGVEDNWFECPQCGATNSKLVCGDDLQIVGLEMKEPQPVAALVTG